MACVEPYEPKSEFYERSVVIEGMVTSELKVQEIAVSETYALDVDSISYVTDAKVRVFSSEGDTYNFFYDTNGKYRSEQVFMAREGVNYQLEVEVNGNVYQSDKEKITGYSDLENVVAKEAVNDEGEIGVSITVNSNALNDDSKYYRYTYEETYKIVSPYTQAKYFINNGNGVELVDVPAGVEREVCYNTLNSQKGILSNTDLQNDNDQNDQLIKFLRIDDFKIINRYSILVRQHVISGDAFRFYQTLDELSNSESVFAQNQPGFLAGNIENVSNSDENVVGYFEVASVQQKRIFFSFLDIFDYTQRRDLRVDCPKSRPLSADLVYYIRQNLIQYLSPAPPSESPYEGPWYLVPIECIDCRVLGTPVKPEFWIDE
ncbi:DUF4249 domain-containing protein [Christiangramia sp. SM2212]|uniref:DUF4249 domain-containing protein n=1 Tax=Christiangramia sediminicola TaxID=3073267 RepID=A0ABU1EQK1_9FLAO|nr:DUF4249 domain-containing protein [Christiangramia sp. SM2212]MDR5590438.1 DUF4249 domain-containing protein [Christiangramia sp. SM2212]